MDFCNPDDARRDVSARRKTEISMRVKRKGRRNEVRMKLRAMKVMRISGWNTVLRSLILLLSLSYTYRQ